MDEKAGSARLGWGGRLGKALQRENIRRGRYRMSKCSLSDEGSGSMKKKRAERPGHAQQDERAEDL